MRIDITIIDNCIINKISSFINLTKPHFSIKKERPPLPKATFPQMFCLKWVPLIMIIVCRKGWITFSRLKIQPGKKSILTFCYYIIATEIDKFLFEICSQIFDLPSKFLNFDFRLSLWWARADSSLWTRTTVWLTSSLYHYVVDLWNTNLL